MDWNKIGSYFPRWINYRDWILDVRQTVIYMKSGYELRSSAEINISKFYIIIWYFAIQQDSISAYCTTLLIKHNLHKYWTLKWSSGCVVASRFKLCYLTLLFTWHLLAQYSAKGMPIHPCHSRNQDPNKLEYLSKIFKRFCLLYASLILSVFNHPESCSRSWLTLDLRGLYNAQQAIVKFFNASVQESFKN